MVRLLPRILHKQRQGRELLWAAHDAVVLLEIADGDDRRVADLVELAVGDGGVPGVAGERDSVAAEPHELALLDGRALRPLDHDRTAAMHGPVARRRHNVRL